MSEHEGIDKVIEGYRHFSEEVYPEHRELFEQLKDQQHPQVLFITCADSRIDPCLITNTGPGDLFVCRNIGNIVPTSDIAGGLSAVLEYAVSALKVKHIILCGHSDCGAMKALRTLDSPTLASMPAVKGWLRHAEAALGMARSNHGQPSGDDLTTALIHENVLLQLQHLRTHRVVAEALAAGTLQLHGWIYNIGTGKVDALDASEKRFQPVA